MAAKKPDDRPIFGELLASDLLYGFMNVADLGVVGLASLDPSVLWYEMKHNPWLAMLVYDDMEEKDDVVASSLDTRKDGVLAKSRQVLPASDKRQDRKVAEFVQETLDGYFIKSGERYSGLNQILWETLDAVGKGVAIGEIIFGDAGDRIRIEDVKFKPQGLFTFGEGVAAQSNVGPQTGPLRLRSAMGIEGVGVDGLLPESKFLVASYRPKQGNRWGTALSKKVFWPSWFKRAGTKVWLKNLEKGSGTVLARYPDGAAADEKRIALDAARAINEESSAAVPNKFKIEVMEHVRQAMGDSYAAFTDTFQNNAIMRVILGQTLTSRGSEGGKGSQALGDVHNQVRAEKIEADSKFLMHVINKYMVKPIVLFNFGPSTPLPLWIIKYDPKRDQSADSVVHSRLSGMGLKIPLKWAYAEYQIPEPADGEEVLEPPATPEGDPATGVDPSADFAEKKTPLKGRPSTRSSSKMERFSKLHPSTTGSSKQS
jgi:phage gp29-like protein